MSFEVLVLWVFILLLEVLVIGIRLVLRMGFGIQVLWYVIWWFIGKLRYRFVEYKL